MNAAAAVAVTRRGELEIGPISSRGMKGLQLGWNELLASVRQIKVEERTAPPAVLGSSVLASM